jgi:membrane-associated phospholipid phosphatase
MHAEHQLSLRNRFFLLCIPLVIQLFYFPLNRISIGGIAPFIPLDAYIPVRPAWVVPYFLTIPSWIIFFIWAGFKMDDQLFRAFIFSSITAILIGILTFTFFPTYVNRPVLVEKGIAWDWLRKLYQNDNIYNALPSGHAYITTIVAIFWWRWKPNQRWLWVGFWVVVLLSALFTHQHYILDLLAGILLALGTSFLAFGIYKNQGKVRTKYFFASDEGSD